MRSSIDGLIDAINSFTMCGISNRMSVGKKGYIYIISVNRPLA
jgi:hypothetical protein